MLITHEIRGFKQFTRELHEARVGEVRVRASRPLTNAARDALEKSANNKSPIGTLLLADLKSTERVARSKELFAPTRRVSVQRTVGTVRRLRTEFIHPREEPRGRLTTAGLQEMRVPR